ncbi:PAS domain-containing protein [Dyadobacter sp. NIV53]|uniref:PAS domain-containing sensor histidine kinase n=1 Tax=Dyadobacter sp. NIV53 TaxID=2861765 RepID=UPI001E5F01D6|nr:PAS domain-containing protein [Dyadobacter sp. NIV53]
MIRRNDMPFRMVGSMQDVTAQVQAQQARKESDDKLSFALKSAQLGTWSLDPETNIIEWDARTRELYGYLKDESIPIQDLFRYIHPEDQNKVRRAVKEAITCVTDGSYNVQFRTIAQSDQKVRWLHCRGQAYFRNDGQAYRFAGIAQDITDQRADQEKAYFADQQAAMTLEGTGAGSFLVDVSTDEIIYSPAMAKIITGEITDKINRSVFIDHLHPDDSPIRNQAYQLAAETGELNYEARFVWNDGTVHWVKVIGRYLYDNSGKGVSLSGILFDISDRIESEQKIRSSEEYLRSMIEQAPVATALFLGKDMVIEIPNETMLKYWGKGNEVLGKPLREAIPELVGQPFLEILDEVYRSGQTYHAEGEPAELIIDNVLQTFYFDYTYKPLRNHDGEVYAIMDMAVDVTSQVIAGKELKESEERYRQLADELELRIQQRTHELRLANQELINSNNNLQQFAYAASHDMQEPLRKIQSFSSRLQEMYTKELDKNGIFMLNRMQDAAKRMSMMIDDLLAYSRLTTKEGEFVAVDLNTIITEVISDLEIGIQEQGAQIEVDQLPSIFGNQRQLLQLFQNLISNAIKYRLSEQIPEISITYQKTSEEEVANFPNFLKDHPYVLIKIQDNGIGFDEKYLDRIFQMFQRLHGKSEYSGSGIGLALCKKVAQNHHGYITAKSAPGEGSVFMVYLPQPL